jgi:hypothetical protein
MTVRRIMIALLSLALAACVAGPLAGCAPVLPTAPAGITGTVTSLVPGDERPASMMVEGPTQPAGAVSDKAQVTIEPATMFFDAQGKSTKGSSIAVGTQVKVWFQGAVAESYPVQGSASAVQILGK